jgi:hypothetical protein
MDMNQEENTMKITIIFTAFVLLTLNFNVHAASMVEIKSKEGLSRMYSEKNIGKMEIAGGEDYMLLNSRENTLYIIMPDKETAFDMNQSLKGSDAAFDKSIKVTFKKTGSGPEIAGYRTTAYNYKANGTYCGSLFTSK